MVKEKIMNILSFTILLTPYLLHSKENTKLILYLLYITLVQNLHDLNLHKDVDLFYSLP